MKFLWCDTETTGLETSNAAPFEVAFIFVYSDMYNGRIVRQEAERNFFLNPFDISGIEYNEDAGKVHGYSKEKIMSFDPSKEAVKKIDDCLQDFVNFMKPEKLIFCGYNSNEFDFNHLCSLFNHHGFDFSKYISGKLDVFKQVKKAGEKKILPYLPNRKLTTIAEYLKIPMDNAHDALCDIRATREVAKSLASKGVKLQ